MKIKLLSLLGGALLMGTAGYSSGFQVNAQGQKQIGMGHAGTGLALDQSSIFFNPGALSHLRQNGFQVGASFINARTTYQNTENNYTSEAQPRLGTPFQVYAAFGPQEGKWKAGLGIYTPFGSTVEYENGWAGQFVLNQLSLKAIFIQPTLSYAITDKIGIGAGFVYATGDVNLQKSIPVQFLNGKYGKAELDGSASGVGYNVGLYLKPTDKLSVGITYRSKVDMEVNEGEASFVVPAGASANFTANAFTATLPLPGSLNVGVGFMPTDKLTLALDANFIGWSAYKALTFDYNGFVGGTSEANRQTSSPRNYKDSYAVRLGGQYAVSEAITVRAGAYYDKTPVQNGYVTAETPDSDRIGLSTGATFKLGETLDLDLSLLYIEGKKRTQTASDIQAAGTQADVISGTYKSKVVIPGLGLSYKF